MPVSANVGLLKISSNLRVDTLIGGNIMKSSSGVRFVLLTVILGTSGWLHAADRMMSGQWELTMTTKGEAQVLKFCADTSTLRVANGDARTGREALSKLHAETGCKVTDFKVEGNTVSYGLACPDRTVRITETYHGDHYEGVLKTKTVSEEITTNSKAHRLGVCP